MINDKTDSLDALVEDLPRDVQPGRDLWPQIEAGLEPRGRGRNAWQPALWRMTAAALLIVGSSLTTAWFMQRNQPAPIVVSTGELGMVPARLTNDTGLGQKYLLTRRLLIADFEQRYDRLPEETRLAVMRNLKDIQTALEEINAALAVNPDNALLQQLLVTTYQEELDVLSGVNTMTLTRTDI